MVLLVRFVGLGEALISYVTQTIICGLTTQANFMKLKPCLQWFVRGALYLVILAWLRYLTFTVIFLINEHSNYWYLFKMSIVTANWWNVALLEVIILVGCILYLKNWFVIQSISGWQNTWCMTEQWQLGTLYGLKEAVLGLWPLQSCMLLCMKTLLYKSIINLKSFVMPSKIPFCAMSVWYVW